MIVFALVVFLMSCITWIAFWATISNYDKKTSVILFFVSLVLTLFWLIAWLPFFQPMFFYLFYGVLGFWIVLSLILISAAFIGLIVKSWGASGVYFLICFVIWLIIFGSFNSSWTRQNIYKSLAYEEVEIMPNTTAVRYLPLEVAWRYGENRLQEPMVQHVDADPVIKGNEMHWILTRAPRGFWNEALRNSDGFTIVDSRGDVSTIRQKMTIGEGMLGSDHILWKLRQKRYWSEVTEIYYIQSEKEEVVAVAPYLNYSFKFPVMVPHFGGVFLVHSNGSVEDLTPQEAMQNHLLKDARIFPEKLARLYVEAYAYKNGIANTIFKHQDQIEIPSVGPSETGYLVNEMPFLLPTDLGQKWVVAANAWGAQGIYRLFFVDAITGKVELLTMSGDSTLIGPIRARDYVVRAYPAFKWDQILVLEPRPIMKQGVLYWMFTLTPNTFAGIVDTVLVNSQTNEVLSLGSNYQEMIGFLLGEKKGRIAGIGESPIIDATGQIINQTVDKLSQKELRQVIGQLKELTDRLERLLPSLPEK
ncbi:MAG: hypothetical protein HYV47_01490 [Candidatus Nealsonbacteria bacterium]|nr:hypothetical protein [Candidatus Nealsonbacteria bacterium]